MTRSRIHISNAWLTIVALTLLFTACGDKKEEGARSKEPESKIDKKPKIAAKKPDFNFGKVKQGEIVEHIFKIQNQGDAELKIEKAKGS